MQYHASVLTLRLRKRQHMPDLAYYAALALIDAPRSPAGKAVRAFLEVAPEIREAELQHNRARNRARRAREGYVDLELERQRARHAERARDPAYKALRARKARLAYRARKLGIQDLV